MSDLSTAIIIATEAHRGQTDKAGEDYILHPLRIMLKAKTATERIVAILHDVVEDTQVTLRQLEDYGFDNEIIVAIDALSRRSGESYMDFIKRCKENDVGRKVKVLDLMDNSDLCRLPNVTKDDERRVEKYRKAIAELLQ